MRVLDKYVLIRHTMTKKQGVIIRDAARNEGDQYDSKFEVLQKGDKCVRDFSVGELVIFTKHVSFQAVMVIEKNSKGTMAEVIVYEDDIIGIDDTPIADTIIDTALKSV